MVNLMKVKKGNDKVFDPNLLFWGFGPIMKIPVVFHLKLESTGEPERTFFCYWRRLNFPRVILYLKRWIGRGAGHCYVLEVIVKVLKEKLYLVQPYKYCVKSTI